MVATISFNPLVMTTAAGSFSVDSVGYIVGTALDSPAIRYSLAGGVLDVSETLPMWGGVGIYENVPGASGTPDAVLGSLIGRATSVTAGASKSLTGFSVFDQNYSMINSPQSPVPLAASGMQVNFYRLGSGARIAVACDPSLVDLEGNIITQNVSWDFNDQRLQPYVSTGGTETISTATWSSTNGGQVALVMAAPSVFNLGDTIFISGATNSGTGGNSIVNGAFVINTWTDNEHFTFLLPAASGVVGTIGGSPVINVGTGALPVKILKVSVGNSMSVLYNPTTGFATWDRSDTAAIILI